MSSVGKIRRLLQILEYLQSGRRYHTGDLSSFVGVSKRTIFRDLKVLQDSGVQLLYDETAQGYWMPPSTFLPPTDLTVNETLSLLLLGEKLGDSTLGIPFQETAREGARKLLANLPSALRSHLSQMSEHLEITLEPKHPLLDSQPHFQRVLEAMNQRCKIRLLYHSLSEGSQISTLVSPYKIFFQSRTWYVIGRSSLHKEVRTFHVGRILESTLTPDEYVIPPRFSLQRHFGNAWRMIREKPKVEVVVRFQPQVASNVSEVVWHATQRVVWNPDKSMDYHVTVEGIREISWWILGYGDQAEVMAPQSLRDLVESHVKRMAAVYRKSTSETITTTPTTHGRRKSAQRTKAGKPSRKKS